MLVRTQRILVVCQVVCAKAVGATSIQCFLVQILYGHGLSHAANITILIDLWLGSLVVRLGHRTAHSIRG